MQILILTTSELSSPAGAGRYFPIAKRLAACGHRVSYLALHPDFSHLENKVYTQDGVEIRYAGSMHIQRIGNVKRYYSPLKLGWVTLKSTLMLSYYAIQLRPEVILVGKPHPMNSLAGLAAKLVRRSRLIVDFDDFEAASTHFNHHLEKSVIEFFENHMGRLAGFVTTNTWFMKDRLQRLGVRTERIHYLSNGINPDDFTHIPDGSVQQLKKELGLEGRQVIAFIGSLSLPNHPVHLLIEAFSLVQKSLDEVALLLVGGGNSFDQLHDLALASGLSDRIHFTGRVLHDQVGLYYRLADVVVDPVIDDGAARGRQPIKIFESWAAGVPFITGDSGDRSYLAGDPPALWLCRPGDPASLAEAIIRVFSNSTMADELVQRGLARVQGYTHAKIVDEFLYFLATPTYRKP